MVLAPGQMRAQSGSGQAVGGPPHNPATGTGTATTSSTVANAQQSLYTASGQNGAQPTQDSYKGSIVEGKSTGTVIDLPLDERQSSADFATILGCSCRPRPRRMRTDSVWKSFKPSCPR